MAIIILSMTRCQYWLLRPISRQARTPDFWLLLQLTLLIAYHQTKWKEVTEGVMEDDLE